MLDSANKQCYNIGVKKKRSRVPEISGAAAGI